VARSRILDDILVEPESTRSELLRVLYPSTRRSERDHLRLVVKFQSWVAAKAATSTAAANTTRPAAVASSTETIWYHAEMSYSAGSPDNDPVAVSNEEHFVLQAFGERAAAMHRGELERLPV